MLTISGALCSCILFDLFISVHSEGVEEMGDLWHSPSSGWHLQLGFLFGLSLGGGLWSKISRLSLKSELERSQSWLSVTLLHRQDNL